MKAACRATAVVGNLMKVHATDQPHFGIIGGHFGVTDRVSAKA